MSGDSTVFEELRLSPRPEMTDPGYLEAAQRAGYELRLAEPWLLVRYPGAPQLVARRRTFPMQLLVWAVNLWRRPRRWWLGRLQLAYEARQRARKA